MFLECLCVICPESAKQTLETRGILQVLAWVLGILAVFCWQNGFLAVEML